jgi:hypothetical protein
MSGEVMGQFEGPQWVKSRRSASAPLAREADVPPLAWIGRKPSVRFRARNAPKQSWATDKRFGGSRPNLVVPERKI